MNLVAGHELDVLVAQKVFGMKVWVGATSAHVSRMAPTLGGPNPERISPYSTNLTEAWAVVNKLERHTFILKRIGNTLPHGATWSGKLSWKCSFTTKDAAFQGESESPALAICLAALRAMEANP